MKMENLEEVLGQLQMQNQQLQNVLLQKQTLLLQSKEIEKALEEIEKEDTQEIYRSVGPILVKTEKAKVKKERNYFSPALPPRYFGPWK